MMLLGDTPLNYVLIRGSILALRLIAPASILYCIILPSVQPRQFFARPLPLPLSIWAIAESSFYALVYLPSKFTLQRAVVHPPPPAKEERRSLFQRCLDTITEPELYFSRWFLGASVAEIKRDNLKEFYAWSMMNKRYDEVQESEDAELDGYVDQLEGALEISFGSGYGNVRSLRGTLDSVDMQHRPLLWYLIVGIVDVMSSARLLISGYQFYREPVWPSLTMLPLRPLSFLGHGASPAPKVSYWYREHTARDRLPVVFLHGIGVGMYAYVSFLAELSRNLSGTSKGDIGILAPEILPVSARICAPALSAADMRDAIKDILKKHGWRDFILVGHSYGSAIAASMIRDPELRGRIKAAVLMDPICFMLHLPDISYNFTRRKPTKPSEWMLYYFSSQDMMISHTITRRFFWNDVILWHEDIAHLPVTVTLSGHDIIVPTDAVWRYLTDSSSSSSDQPTSFSISSNEVHRTGTCEWKRGPLNVLWFDRFNHADLFDTKSATRGIVEQIHKYSARGGHQSGYTENGDGL